VTAERYVAAIAAATLFLGAAAAGRFAVRSFRSPVEPIAVFLAAWGVALALFAIPWVAYTPTRATVWGIIYGSIGAFVAGAAFTYRLLARRVAPRPQRVSRSYLRIIWLATLLLSMIGFGAYVQAVDSLIGWRALIDDPTRVRELQSAPEFLDAYGLWKLLTYLANVALLLWTIALRVRAFGGWWVAASPLGVLAILPFLFSADRTIIPALLLAACFHLLLTPRVRLRSLAITGTVTAVSCVTLFVILGDRIGKTVDNQPEIADALTTKRFSELAFPYVYVTAPIPAFNQLTADPLRPRTHGAATLLPAVKVAHQLDVGPVPPTQVSPFYSVPFDFNTFTWLREFFLDFGYVGCLVIPALFGAGASLLTVLVYRSRTIFGIWMLSAVLMTLLFAPLGTRSLTITWEYLLVGVLVAPLIGAPRDHAHGRMRMRPRYALIGALIVTASVILATVAVESRANRGNAFATPSSISRLLVDVDESLRRAGQPSSALPTEDVAERLHFRDPATEFQALPASYERPLPRTVGVSISANGYWLKARSEAGTLVELYRRIGGGTSRKDLLARRGSNTAQRWLVGRAGNTVLKLRREPGDADVSPRLRIIGTGRKTKRPSFVATVVSDNLPSRGPGSRYALRIHAHTEGLSRPVPVELKFIYGDGTYSFRSAHIPAGSMRRKVVIVSNRATKPLHAIQVFVADIVGSMRGEISISNAVLAVTDVRGAPRRIVWIHDGKHELIDNGGFEYTGNDAWAARRSPNATFLRDRRVAHSGTRSMHVRGTGRASGAPAFLVQRVIAVPRNEAGTTFELRVAARQRGLTRRVAVEVKFDYRDGSHEFFSRAIRPTRDRSWQIVKVAAIAKKPLAAIDVFPADLGTIPLKGELWLDDVSFRLTHP
jgi:oligosaccharide repeat unit polymerase